VGRGRKTIGGLVAVLLATVGVGQAIGATEQIAASPTCCQFSKANFTIDAGQVANFSNTGDTSHDVTAQTDGPDGQKLFESETITAGKNSPVVGTQYLTPGSYPFFCSIHPEMVAQLTVGAGAPVARPAVKLKVTSKKVDKVASSGKLLVKVTAQAASQSVVVTAKKGSLKLGKASTVADLAAGASQTLKFKLSGSQKNKLDGLNSAKIKVSATVPFGTPAKTSRTLK
jgi:plastocyanin